MANTSTEPVAEGRKFKADTTRIAILAIGACCVYGGGIISVMLSAYITVKAFHAHQGVPAYPWVISFILVVSGMLSVIYGFFLRPREARLSPTQVAVVFWDGNGKTMDRDKVESMDVGKSRIVLKGGGKRVVVSSMFTEWKTLRAELAAWRK
ncbi:MAG: hypothetical protein ABIW76_11105 [Fibrobacteria bacterium]